jgi:hypothetical protein
MLRLNLYSYKSRDSVTLRLNIYLHKSRDSLVLELNVYSYQLPLFFSVAIECILVYNTRFCNSAIEYILV